MSSGYWESPWPCEDGGPQRFCSPATRAVGPQRGLPAAPEPPLNVKTREVFSPTMVVLRDPGEVYLLGHSMGTDTSSWVERIHPESLETVMRSPELEGGPFWPGGIAAHANGDLYLTYGRWCHRLTPDCELVASVRLPQDRPYNSMTILDDGSLVMKDQVRDGSANSRLVVLEPDRLEQVTVETECPESVVARLSSDGSLIYAVGTTSAFRYAWNARSCRLELDDTWRVRYLTSSDQSYGWDPVIADGCVWFMDNGDHRYSTTMRGAGVASGPVHLVCAPADLGADGQFTVVEVCGAARGAITNPPAIDTDRKIAVAYDSANGVLAAWRYLLGESGEVKFEPLWRTGINTACHIIRYPESGILVANDFGEAGDDVVLIRIEDGSEIVRAATGSPVQSVLFLTPGWENDLYYCSFAELARIHS